MRSDGTTGLSQGRVRAMLEDQRGDLWVGSFGGGVQRVAAAARRDGPLRRAGAAAGPETILGIAANAL